MNHTYGYVKVSSKDQNENRQLIAMRDFGMSEALKKNSCDTFVIKSIDRLYRD